MPRHSSETPSKPPASAVVASTLSTHKTLVATLVLTALAAAYPNPGASVYSAASLPLIVSLFFFLGLTVRVDEFAHATTALRLHVACQVFSLGLTPFAYWAVFERWGVARHILGSRALATGTMAAMCLPTTTNTCVMFTQQAGGDVSAATINAALGNVLGAFVAPVVAALTLGEKVARQSLGGVFLSCVEKIIAPLFAGLAAQLLFLQQRGQRAGGRNSSNGEAPRSASRSRRAGWCGWCDAALAAKATKICEHAQSLILVAFLYLIFCDAFASKDGSHGIDMGGLARLSAFLLVLHGLLVSAAWLVSGPASEGDVGRRVAFVLTAPQKTESLGVAILTSIFSDDDDHVAALTLPIVLYHTIQMICAACAVASLRRLAAAIDDDDDDARVRAVVDDDDDDDGCCDGLRRGSTTLDSPRGLISKTKTQEASLQGTHNNAAAAAVSGPTEAPLLGGEGHA